MYLVFVFVFDMLAQTIHGQPAALQTEIDISVSKLLSFETFAKSLRVSVSVSENLASEKSLGFGFEKKSWSRFRKIWSRKRKKPNNKSSVCNDVPNLGLGPNWD